MTLIRIGLAGWGDHDGLYPDPESRKRKLLTYGTFYGIVEIDSSFYAIQPLRNYEKWCKDTPEAFQFVVKAYQAMTGHRRGSSADRRVAFEEFRLSIQPMLDCGKLSMILFQYPPWFDCTREHVQELRDARERYRDLPLALEFRHRSWYSEEYRERTLAYMREDGWIHSVCDEPQAGEGSIPIVPISTDARRTLVRFHGRNVRGWSSKEAGPNWRQVRYLYRYSDLELEEWIARLKELEQGSETVDVIFNNNSGGDAADNAFRMMELLGQEATRPATPHSDEEGPEQLALFE